MKQLLFLLFFISQSYATVQDKIPNDESFDTFVKLYSNFIYKDDSKALMYALKAKGIATIRGNNKQLAQAFFYVSKCQHRLGKNKLALKSIESAISQTTIKDTIFLYKSFCLKGHILSLMGNDSKALIAYLKAKEYAKEIGKPIYEIAPVSSIASVRKTHRGYKEAINTYKTILNYLEATETNSHTEYYKLMMYIHIADAYLWMGNSDEAELYNDAGLKKYAADSGLTRYYPLLMNKAIIHYQRKQYDSCIQLTKQVRDYTKTSKNNLHITSLFYLGKSAFNLNNFEESIQYLEKAYTILNTSLYVDTNEKELHEFLAFAYHKVKNTEKTEFHFQKYSALEKKQSAEDIRINNETSKLLDVIPLETALTKQIKSKKELFIIALVLVVLFVSSILYYKLREKSINKKFTKLLKKVATFEDGKKRQGTSQKEKVTDAKAKAILKKIDDFEKNEYYLLSECSLSYMAEKLQTNTAYLSKVINIYKRQSFPAYMSELRINMVLLKLKNDKTLQSYTIKAIAEEFGFKRQETFSKAFKAQTGIYLSQYLKNLRKAAK